MVVPGRSVLMTRCRALSRAAAIPTRRGSPGVKNWDGERREAPGAEDWVGQRRLGVGCVQRSRKDGEAAEKKERVTEYGGDWAGSGRQIEEKKGDGRVERLRGAQQR